MTLPAPKRPAFEIRTVDEDVEVIVDGEWCFGLLKEWARFDEPIGWTGWVTWWGPEGRRNGRFASEHIRPSEDASGACRTPTD